MISPPENSELLGEINIQYKARTKSVPSQTCMGEVMWASGAVLVYLQGKSHITLLTACHREVINYLSKSHQSALGATADLKPTHNITHTNMHEQICTAHTVTEPNPHGSGPDWHDCPTHQPALSKLSSPPNKQNLSLPTAKKWFHEVMAAERWRPPYEHLSLKKILFMHLVPSWILFISKDVRLLHFYAINTNLDPYRSFNETDNTIWWILLSQEHQQKLPVTST